MTELGDLKPFQLVDYIYYCLGELGPSFLLTHIFMTLPGQVQDALAHLKTNDIETLSEEADHIMALPKKAPIAVRSAQLPTFQIGGSDVNEETTTPDDSQKVRTLLLLQDILI